MSIVPFSALSCADMAILGNNLSAPRRRRDRNLAAVNRSLAAWGEAVSCLHRPLQTMPALDQTALPDTAGIPRMRRD